MSVEVKLTSVKPLSNTSTTSIVELSNFNFRTLVSAIKEFLTSVHYNQNDTEVTVDINTVAADLVTVRNGLKVYGAQLQDGNYPTVIELHPSGSATASNFIADDVMSTLRLRLRVYGLLPSTGIPGELVYIEAQGNRVEGVYVWLTSTGWTLLAGAGYGASPCMQEVIMSAVADTVSTDNTVASSSLFVVPAPLASSNFLVFINGLQTQVGDAVKTLPTYFSKDGGLTASAIRDVDSSDVLYWNTSIAGYDLADYDTITLHYSTIDPFCSQSGYSCLTMIASGSTFDVPQFGIQIIGTPDSAGPMTVCLTPSPTVVDPNYPLPDGYLITNTILSFSISDNFGIFSGGAIVRFTLPQSISEDDFNLVRVFHEVNGVLVDETVLSGPYEPDYANRWVYAQVSEFSPFYLIQGISLIPETTTTTVPMGPLYCPPNEIGFYIPVGKNPTQVSFFGLPAGPHTVTFEDQLGGIHDLTGLLGDFVTFPWTFDLSNDRYAEVPTVIGVYTFTYSPYCQYEVEVPISSIGTVTTTSTTTTTAAAPTTTTTTMTPTTTTTTAGPTTTTTTATPTTTTTTVSVNYLISSPTAVTFFGSPAGPYDVIFTDPLLNIYDLSSISGSQKTLSWTFNLTLQAYIDAGITTMAGTYEFWLDGSLAYTIVIPVEAVPTTTTTTTTTAAPTTTTTTVGISYLVSNVNIVEFFGSPAGPYDVNYTDGSLNVYSLSTLAGQKTLPWTHNKTLQAYVDAGITTISGTYDFIIDGNVVYSIQISI